MIKNTKWFLVITAVIWVIYDIIAVSIGGVEATISYQMKMTAQWLSLLPFAWGVLGSHFFAPYIIKGKVWRYFVWIPISIGVMILAFNGIVLDPFLMLLSGLIVGLFWAQEKIKK